MKRSMPLDTSTYMRVNVVNKLTDLAEEKGWLRDGMDGNFPKFKKGDVVISICNTCGGGFINPIEPKAPKYYRAEARKYLING